MNNLFQDPQAILLDYIKNKYDPDEPLFLWVDLFCGCGGVTEGYSQVPNNFVVACVNHDPYAIKSHHANHPYCLHYTEDIRDFEVIRKITELIKILRSHFPGCIVGLHASLECTHFSKAKGGMARDADSRTLGEHLINYLSFFPDYITIENVEEFLDWGPIDENGKAGKSKKGIFYDKWVTSFEDKGFDYEYRILNSADYGESTARKRYFGCYALAGLPITFPLKTHAPKNKLKDFPDLLPYEGVKSKIDLADQGSSIFGLTKQGKPYSDKTISRVYYGLVKFYGDSTFISTYYGASKNGQGVYSLESPLGTITTKDRFALHHIQYAYGNPTYSAIDSPSQVITTTPKHELVTSSWLFDTQFGNIGRSLNRPAPTIIARQDKKPLYLASATAGNLKGPDLRIKRRDSEAMKNLKNFMTSKGIIDVKIRTLTKHELLRIQGFPDDYILEGGVTRAKKYIGNSVCPKQAKVNAIALYQGFKNNCHEKEIAV